MLPLEPILIVFRPLSGHKVAVGGRVVRNDNEESDEKKEEDSRMMKRWIV